MEEIKTKICGNKDCKLEKPLSEFHNHKKGKFGKAYWYKFCTKKYRQSDTGKESRKRGDSKYRENHFEECKERQRLLDQKRRKSGHTSLYQQNKRLIDINYQLSMNLRSRVRSAIKSNSKSKHTQEFLGCTIEELKAHLKSQFVKGMNWENYGKKNNENWWEIDHIVACSKFDLSDPFQQQLCFHWTNLQPLWRDDNRNKSNK